jgi:hypothetical protein
MLADLSIPIVTNIKIIRPPLIRPGAFVRISARVGKMPLKRIEMKTLPVLTLALALGCSTSLFAAQDPMVGGSAMSPKKDIVENPLNSSDHTTPVAAVKAAGLVDTLEGPGPFTIFAPS